MRQLKVRIDVGGALMTSRTFSITISCQSFVSNDIVQGKGMCRSRKEAQVKGPYQKVRK